MATIITFRCFFSAHIFYSNVHIKLQYGAMSWFGDLLFFRVLGNTEAATLHSQCVFEFRASSAQVLAVFSWTLQNWFHNLFPDIEFL
jgi:hypothetical protein